MNLRAQHGYYNLPSASAVLDQRIQALSDAIPRGATILDLGCNDCSISTTLLRKGIVSEAFGYDLEDIRQEIVPGVNFVARDLMELSVSELPNANGVLMLNVLHHLLARSPERAKAFFYSLLDRYEFVIIDMGSFSEKGDWGWRQSFNSLWRSDVDMWSDLFAPAKFKFKLLRYPTQGDGHRVLWKLRKHAYDLSNLEVCATYHKNPGSSPLDKHLVQVENASLIDLEKFGNVYFEKLVSKKRDFFWRKNYSVPTSTTIVQLEFRLTQLCGQILSSFGACSVAGVTTPVVTPQDSNLTYIYEPDLFLERPVHYQDWLDYIDLNEVADLLRISAWPVQFKNFHSNIQFLNLTDFQAARCWDGIKICDLEPNLWVRELEERINWF